MIPLKHAIKDALKMSEGKNIFEKRHFNFWLIKAKYRDKGAPKMTQTLVIVHFNRSSVCIPFGLVCYGIE